MEGLPYSNKMALGTPCSPWGSRAMTGSSRNQKSGNGTTLKITIFISHTFILSKHPSALVMRMQLVQNFFCSSTVDWVTGTWGNWGWSAGPLLLCLVSIGYAALLWQMWCRWGCSPMLCLCLPEDWVLLWFTSPVFGSLRFFMITNPSTCCKNCFRHQIPETRVQ